METNILRTTWIKVFALMISILVLFSAAPAFAKIDNTGSFKLIKSWMYVHKSRKNDRFKNARSVFVFLKNKGSKGFDAPIMAVIDSISDPAVTVGNADGTTQDGKPYFMYDIQIPRGTLAPGRVSWPKRWTFVNAAAPFRYTVKVYTNIEDSTDSHPPSLTITNPVDLSVIFSQQPEITIKFNDDFNEDDSGIDTASFNAKINNIDYTHLFNVTQDQASLQTTDQISLGDNSLSVTISDINENSTTVESNFSVVNTTEPIRYIFSVEDNDWIFASPGDGTCIGYLNPYALGVTDFSDITALSQILPGGDLYFGLADQNLILQSPGDGTNSVLYNDSQLNLGAEDQLISGHIDFSGTAYFSIGEQPDILQSSGDNSSSLFMENYLIGLDETDLINCLHIGYDGTVYFCHPDGQSIAQSDGSTSSFQFLTAAELGVPGSIINAFAILPETVPPIITITNPVNGAFLNTTTPAITISFSDEDSGIDASSFYAEINGVDVTSEFTLTDSGASYQVPQDAQLPVGANTLYVKIQDRVGNANDVTSDFNIGILRAIPGATPVSGTAPLTVHFTTDGEDPAGTIEVFRWDFYGDGSWDTYDTVASDYNRTYDTPGTYNAVLYVQSSTGKTVTATVTITVENNPPVATADVQPSNGEVPLAAQLSGSGSDSDGNIVLYEWDFEGDGTYDWSSASTGNTSHTYTSVGTFNAIFRVTDNSGLTATAHATTTTIRTGPPGSPTATASASPTSGNAPLNVNFNGSATDPDNDVVLYEWDFDNDGTYDWSSTTTGNTSNIYNTAGTHSASLRVTDSSGLIGIDQILITVNIQASLSISDDTVGFLGNPDEPEPVGTNINTFISAGSQVSILIKDTDGNVARTLVNNEYRNMGSSADYWDCKDDNGIVVNDGVYYAVMQYVVDGEVKTNDLTDLTGGVRFNPSRQSTGGSYSNPAQSKPFEDSFLPVNFSLNTASEVTLFVGTLQGSNTRIRTIYNRVPMPNGSHTAYWDGLDDSGEIAEPPPGVNFILGIWGYTLPDNAIVMTGGKPEITQPNAEPNYFSPFSEKCDVQGNGEGILLSYNVSEDVSSVELRVFNMETGYLIRTVTQQNISAGENAFFWDGKNFNGEYPDIGDYQVGLIATDAQGNESLIKYSLIRIDY